MYYIVDEALKNTPNLPTPPVRKRQRKPRMSDSEVITILILFHQSKMRYLKTFYLQVIKTHHQKDFPYLLSYSRFVERQLALAEQLWHLLKHVFLDKTTDISYIDSTPLKSCHIKREHQHRTMKEFARKGKSTMGWYYGMKQHLEVNHLGGGLLCCSSATVHDLEPIRSLGLLNKVKGKVFGDRGYVSYALSKELEQQEITLITKQSKHHKPIPLSPEDAGLLRQRGIAETAISLLKLSCQIEHSRHRSPWGFSTNLASGLIAYQLRPNRPRIKLPKTYAKSA